MKRFVTYLYECERGNKIKNVGFIRINVRGNETTMEVYIRNFSHGNGVGKMYAVIYKEEIQGIELGELKISGGQSDGCFVIETEDIMESGFSLNHIVGIGIRFNDGKYIASCWKDEYAGEIVRGEFFAEDEVADVITSKELVSSSERIMEQELSKEELEEDACDENESHEENFITYEKIDLSQIRDLPSPNWHLSTNSFLVHGFWNYGYLVLKKEMEEGKEILSLGVPGIFEKPEAVMAILFGFPNFETITTEMKSLEKEKNQEAKDGTFGCWFIKLKI